MHGFGPIASTWRRLVNALPAFTAEEHGQPPITAANSGGGKLTQTRTEIGMLTETQKPAKRSLGSD
jgi:hypothetical protein